MKRVVENLEPNFKQNLGSGFKKCGIYPCDEQLLLDRIAHKQVEPSAVSAAFLDVLQSTRDACTVQPKLARKKKISVPAGKSLSHDEVLMSGPTGNDKQSTEQHSAKKYFQPGCIKSKKIKHTKKLNKIKIQRSQKMNLNVLLTVQMMMKIGKDTG